MKQKIAELAAFITFIVGIIAMVILTSAMSNYLINIYQYIGGMGIAGTTMFWDAMWIDKHFINGEWI